MNVSDPQISSCPVTISSRPLSTNALGDRIWYDTNRNGLQDTGETQ